MPYNTELDEQLFSKTWENEEGKIIVSVYSYNHGPKKLQITREFKNREGNLSFAKLGRMTKDEVLGVMPLIQEAVKIM